ncbi:MAG TPA: dihydrofolate reductase family protein, partial [Vicinamibacterales bacterium]|nr:dihydrofolate reductase family protein [Vicinamibacterales bacterium]
ACGVTRVVAAMRDPNPRVSGGGFAYLRQHGVDVSTGDGEAAAQRLNAPFVTWMTQQRPWIIAKSVHSADGFIGRPDGPVRLSGPVADRYFHSQRAEVDAIAVGSRTVLVDDPLLTARLVYRERPLTRVLFDWRLQIPASARVFSTRSHGPVIMIVGRREAERRPGDVQARRAWGCDVEIVADHDMAVAVARLADRGVLSLLVEGGATLQTAFLQAGLVDRVQALRTPKVLGSGIPMPTWPVTHWLVPAGTEPPRGRHDRSISLGDDVLTEWDVHGTD